MKFTVLGADGFIGSRLSEYLAAQRDCTCVRVGRRDPLPLGQHCGHVFYCVGVSGDFLQRPLDTMAAHVSLLEPVLRQCDFDSLVYLSSTRVYQHSASTLETAAITVQPAALSDLYNISKLAGEAMCFCDPRPTVRIARLSNVFDDSFGSATFLTELFQQAKQNGRLRLRSSQDSAKDYLLVEDMLPLLVNIALAGRERIYNVASGVNTTNREITKVFSSVTKCAVDYEPDAPVMVNLPIDISRITRDFAFRPGDFAGSLARSLQISWSR